MRLVQQTDGEVAGPVINRGCSFLPVRLSSPLLRAQGCRSIPGAALVVLGGVRCAGTTAPLAPARFPKPMAGLGPLLGALPPSCFAVRCLGGVEHRARLPMWVPPNATKLVLFIMARPDKKGLVRPVLFR